MELKQHFGRGIERAGDELELLVGAGLTPTEALRAATLDAAAIAGTEGTTGSIAVGKAADFVVVDGVPWEDIADIRRVALGVQEGRVVHASDAMRATIERAP